MVADMKDRIDVKYCFNGKHHHLTLEGDDIFLITLSLHFLGNDSFLVVLLIVLPKVVQDPGVDSQFQDEKSLSNDP